MYVGGLAELILVARLTRSGSKEDRGMSPAPAFVSWLPEKG